MPGAAVMLMETFNRLTRKDKYVWDVSILFESFSRRCLLIMHYRCTAMSVYLAVALASWLLT